MGTEFSLPGVNRQGPDLITHFIWFQGLIHLHLHSPIRQYGIERDNSTLILTCRLVNNRSQWPSCLRRVSAAARLLALRVRIQQGAWMSACCECCVLSVRGVCDGPIPRPEESYRLWCVLACYLETSRMRQAKKPLWVVNASRRRRRRWRLVNHNVYSSAVLKQQLPRHESYASITDYYTI